MDLLLTLVRVEELSEGKGIVQVNKLVKQIERHVNSHVAFQWLSDHGLLDSLIERLDPYLDSEVSIKMLSVINDLLILCNLVGALCRAAMHKRNHPHIADESCWITKYRPKRSHHRSKEVYIWISNLEYLNFWPIITSERVIRKLTNYMLDAKAPNSTSTLINGVTIIIDLIRHNNRSVHCTEQWQRYSKELCLQRHG